MKRLTGCKKTDEPLTPTWEAHRVARSLDFAPTDASSLFGDFNFYGKEEKGWKLEDPDGEIVLAYFAKGTAPDDDKKQEMKIVGYHTSVDNLLDVLS